MDYAEERFSSEKIAGIAFVVLLHIAIIYALVSGLGQEAVQVLRQPLEIKILTPAKLPPPEAPPPPLPKLLQPPPPYIPPPLIQIAQPPVPPVIAAVTRVKPTVAPPPAAPVPNPVVERAAGLDPNQSCAPPQYPDEAADMEQTGRTVLQFLIDGNGNVVNARIASSSGHSLLDDTAEQALSRCKFRPAIGADGKPQEAWTSIGYDWTLN